MHEPNLLQSAPYSEVLRRLARLSPSSPAHWGKMDAAQMLAHLKLNLEMATRSERARQTFMGRIFGSMAERQILRKGMPKNIQSSPHLVVADKRHFQEEKEDVQRWLERFFRAGEAGITKEPHEFFGRMTPHEWTRLHYLHIDHHLGQFGV